MHNRYIDSLNYLEKNANLRVLPNEVPEDFINLSSNDYLGINNDIVTKAEFCEKYQPSKLLFSSTSSRLLTGNFNENELLEDTIANSYDKESCLIFNSGYHTNIGIIPALSGKNDLLLADKLVHASIIDGLMLSKAKLFRYNHLDYNHLETLLKRYRNDYENVFIITESIFSMDGDIMDLGILVKLKKLYNTYLYVDEAHALGVRGEKGLGCVEESGYIRDVDFIVGTFGKALASIGAFVVCENFFKQYLVNYSRSFIYTTALPPINLLWTKFIFEKLKDFKTQRDKLHKISSYFANKLNLPFQSHIIPYIIGSNEKAIEFSKLLKEKGYYVLPIRHPTVPKGTARLRLSLTANLEISELEPLINILIKR
jgi:8-amino-7-oxononanoate synthase